MEALTYDLDVKKYVYSPFLHLQLLCWLTLEEGG